MPAFNQIPLLVNEPGRGISRMPMKPTSNSRARSRSAAGTFTCTWLTPRIMPLMRTDSESLQQCIVLRVSPDKEPDDRFTGPVPDGAVTLGDSYGPNVVVRRQLLEAQARMLRVVLELSVCGAPIALSAPGAVQTHAES